MNLNELHSLYQYLEKELSEYDYLVYEPGVLELYRKMLCGEAARKDFLIFAIKDMLIYIKEKDISEIKSVLLMKFKRIYEK